MVFLSQHVHRFVGWFIGFQLIQESGLSMPIKTAVPRRGTAYVERS
jgi:hypothetical protein